MEQHSKLIYQRYVVDLGLAAEKTHVIRTAQQYVKARARWNPTTAMEKSTFEY